MKEEEWLKEYDQKNGFDKRIVRYEDIHSVENEDFEILLDALSLKSGDSLLDSGCGYGAITIGAFKRLKNNLNYSLNDFSNVQLYRAKEEIDKLEKDFGLKPNAELFFDNITFTRFNENTFDAIGAKMVYHEIKKDHQRKSIAEWHKILKDGGRLVIWDLSLSDWNQELIQDIVRKKDRLSGFDFMVENRYFLREDEILQDLESVGFEKVHKIHDVIYHINTEKRLHAEFGGDRAKVDQWNEYIRNRVKSVPKKFLDLLNYKDNGSFISMQLPKSIFLAVK